MNKDKTLRDVIKEMEESVQNVAKVNNLDSDTVVWMLSNIIGATVTGKKN